MNSEKSSSKSWVLAVTVPILGGIITLGVTFLKPAVEKKGAELAGSQHSGSFSSPTVMGQLANNSSIVEPTKAGAAQSIVSQPFLPRQPRSVKNELQVPSYEDTPQVQYHKSDGEGKGPDRSVAIFNALEEALSKQGSQISVDVRLKLESETKKLNDLKSRRVEQSVASNYHLLTGGLVRWWDIESEEDDGKTVSVKVVAVIATITASGKHDTRKTIVVLPFRVNNSPEFLGETIQGSVFGQSLRESLVTYLVNSRKFAVVDKSFEAELSASEAKTPSSDPVQRAIEAAAKLGAEFVVTGFAEGVGVTSKRVGNLDVPVPDGAISLRIVKVGSRQTMLANSIQVADLPDLNLQGKHLENGIADVIGRKFSERSLEAIYPLKVAALNGPDEVVLNRGGDDLAVGQQFDIANPGDDVRDPATGESLGVAEKLIGRVEVSRVTPKTVYAKVLNKTEEVMIGAVCRKSQLSKAASGKAIHESSAQKNIDSLFK